MTALTEVEAESLETAITRAVGEELRRVREARGWSRAQFVKRLPSKIGDRTLLAYEHGLRQLTLCRLTELTVGLEVDPATVVARGLQRARLHLDRLTLHIDLRALLDHDGAGRGKFRPMIQWARNALNESPRGIAEIDAKVVRNLALFAGCPHDELAEYLAQFTPSPGDIEDEENPDERPQ
ncbi:helix-turn-helix domain-containing protein [Actinophytocola sp.]|uniref:helix-turn-helix domain-containing protein n=1 Tax=Actinophytocola sp. TaxID=1872138 RepID=UPI00389A8DF7